MTDMKIREMSDQQLDQAARAVTNLIVILRNEGLEGRPLVNAAETELRMIEIETECRAEGDAFYPSSMSEEED